MSVSLSRRDFLQALAIAGAASMTPSCLRATNTTPHPSLYQLESFGDLRLLHLTDCHAQLLPVHFREPNVNIGLGRNKNIAPHLVGNGLIEEFAIRDPMLKHAFTYLDFTTSAREYGRMGGFAHLATLIKQLRGDYGTDNTLLLDGGDTWQGSGTAYWTRGQDMVQACNLLGVDIMTGHWEFTYTAQEILKNIEQFNGDFIAQNIQLTEDALFDDSPAFDADTGHVFPPYSLRIINGKRIAIIGQSFPYTPIANPQRFIPDWSFGIRETEMQEMVDLVRDKEKAGCVILLSHNGMDVDKKMASRVTGIDLILGGHTHDAVPRPFSISNAGGTTLVANSGSHGQFLSVVDIQFGSSGISDFRYHLLPIFADLLPADEEMQSLIDTVRKPYIEQLNTPLATADSLMYRRGNFNGSFDQLICDALTEVKDAQIAFSPGFRWGVSVLPGESIRMEEVLTQTCITYPETYRRNMSGEEIKLILEDVADNLFNEDPYYQQGGDMVRLGGMNYTIDLRQGIGKRINDMTLDNGTAIQANKKYPVAGWATVGSQSPGEPIWETVATYLQSHKKLTISQLNTPKIQGLSNNKGIESYGDL